MPSLPPQITLEQNQYCVKSIFDQMQRLLTKVNDINTEISDLYTQLNKKVNLVSEMMDGSIVSTVIGQGLVSVAATSTNVIGVNALFLKYAAAGDQIQIGAEVQTIDSIVNDDSLTVLNPFVNTYVSVIYALIKPATREQLTGDFNFGELNGDLFRGQIVQGSHIEHYGRISTPNDLVNVSFVQKSVLPSMVLARQAIKRTGDTIGVLPPTYTGGVINNATEYDYNNTIMTFDQYSQLLFTGEINPANEFQVVNVKYLLDLINADVGAMIFAHWVYDSVVDVHSCGIVSLYGGGFWSLLSKPPITDASDNILEYFSFDSFGAHCLKSCVIVITVSAYKNENQLLSPETLECTIAKNGVKMSYMRPLARGSDQHQYFVGFPGSASAVISCVAEIDVIAVGIRSNPDNYMEASVSLFRVR